ncbi:KpsF/GutQ family sugar-phosphate isomerase [Algicella marina]|uniref:KpsF/GutQ family sugar-phosphate isomerase n=1 Tax=Algicella marina TaxID=2683284 RepID=A0A6P1T855_9RHOB|nr:KpsF/GutQ family sugar-phosphate isomerase [Algicella marina]QHQ37479.1 KpsF/GutQ family sugar-phosphate isomerase [Algicella marina]
MALNAPELMPRNAAQDIIAHGREVLRVEAEALSSFVDMLDENFAKATQAILNSRGHLIVSGMGKSGHIARKIAATFASTGTPSLFVHPGEASHGDLGKITNADVVLLLSNSGETPELADLIAYTRKKGNTLIGVAARAESTLLKKSDIAILLPQAPEACPNGLAPTTSTTLTLALGDALAVALMNMRGFTPENFRDFHPGGKLGAILATVGDLMHGKDDLPMVDISTPMPEVLIAITSQGFGVAGVRDADGRLAGIITDGDLRRHMANLLAHKAGDVMTPDPVTITAEARASDALAVMNRKKVTTLFVMDSQHRPEGIIHVHDCLRAGVA